MEGENPTRRYKWFRPRQSAQGGTNVVGATQSAVGLFNDSTGSYFLVVRALRCSSGNAKDTVTMASQRGPLAGNTPSAGIPLVLDSPTPPGQLQAADLAAFPPAPFGYTFNIAVAGDDMWWEQPFPFAVIPPGFCFFGALGNGSGVLSMSFVWEYVFPDELDFLYF